MYIRAGWATTLSPRPCNCSRISGANWAWAMSTVPVRIAAVIVPGSAMTTALMESKCRGLKGCSFGNAGKALNPT